MPTPSKHHCAPGERAWVCTAWVTNASECAALPCGARALAPAGLAVALEVRPSLPARPCAHAHLPRATCAHARGSDPATSAGRVHAALSSIVSHVRVVLQEGTEGDFGVALQGAPRANETCAPPAPPALSHSMGLPTPPLTITSNVPLSLLRLQGGSLPVVFTRGVSPSLIICQGL